VDSASGAFAGGPAAKSVEILAHGEIVTAAGYGGDIVYNETPGGGFVFAIGSITVTGGLGYDQALDRLIHNVLDEAVAN
jgi:hypothetical protein